MRVLFLCLKTFSATGGIEKVCKIAGKALFELSSEVTGSSVTLFSLYDALEAPVNNYFPIKIFRGFNNKKIKFTIKSITEGTRKDVVILSHINLLTIGWIIKLFSSKTKLVLIAHGIEVWKPLPKWKRKLLHKVDLILAVSQFTKEQLIAKNDVEVNKCEVLNNCLDPFLSPVQTSNKSEKLLKRYGFNDDNIILMSLTRLSSSEKYKGYDRVINTLPELTAQCPSLRYLIVGKYDEQEKNRMDVIIDELAMTDKVVFAGFVPDEELSDHFNICDVYIMPSKSEGFGIVFIEAMFYGKPVIAGNIDGSVDALANGQLGILVNPDQQEEIIDAVKKVLNDKSKFIPNKELLISKFSYVTYKNNLRQKLALLTN